MNYEPAFPVHQITNGGFVQTGGMTLRDYFAAHAPQMPKWFYEIKGGECDTQRAHAMWAYSYADQMMKARNK